MTHGDAIRPEASVPGAATRVGKATGVALWRQVADHFEQAIAAGTYSAGMRLPPEKEVAERFHVNRHTVRRALAELGSRGLVRSARGSGTYVGAQRIAYPIASRTRFSEIVGASGRQPGGRLVACATEAASGVVARRLGIKAGAAVVRLELLRHADGVPICIGTTWVPAERFPNAASIYAARRSITRMLSACGVTDYRRAKTRVVAAAADFDDSLRLDVKPGSPILLVESVDVDMQGRPVLATRARFAADRVEFVIES